MGVAIAPRARSFSIPGISIGVGLLLAAQAWAGGIHTVFQVNSTADEVDDDIADNQCRSKSGKCTLRAAVMQANEGPVTADIVLPAGIYVLTAPALELNNALLIPPPVNLVGAGAGSTIIDGNHLFGLFKIQTEGPVSISGVTLRNGASSSQGGAIALLLGDLTLDYCVVSNNTATFGGGIYNAGLLQIDHSTVSGNVAATGGGIYGAAGSETHVTSSTVSGNTSNGDFLADGGGVFNDGTFFLANSTISRNNANGDGGGIANLGTFWTYNATIAFNEADSDADEDGGSGGGVFNGSAFYPRNSVIAGNTHSGSPDLDDCSGELGIFGENRISTESGCILTEQNGSAGWDLIGSLSELGPLQFNGGSTRTHALISPSDMIDKGIACIGLGDPPVDQRGGLRTPELTCDLGAVERGALDFDLIFADGFELGNLWAWG